MPKEPQFSVILPTHDRLAYLREAVASVHGQTLAGWKMILVDDGSTDGSVAAIEALGDPRIRVVRHQTAQGPSVARNAGAAARWGPVAGVSRLGRRLACGPSRSVERRLNAGAEAGWCHAAFWRCTADRSPIEAAQRLPPATGSLLEDLLRFTVAIATSAVVVDRKRFEAAGGFDESLRYGQNFDLWLRLAATVPAVTSDRHTVWVRKHAQHERAVVEPCPRAYADRIRIYDKLRRAASDRTVHRICRQRIARYAATLAICHVALGNRRGALAAARRSVRERPAYARGWLSVARASLASVRSGVLGSCSR